MNWFLYDNYLRHERVKGKLNYAYESLSNEQVQQYVKTILESQFLLTFSCNFLTSLF